MKRIRDTTGKYVTNPDKGVKFSMRIPRSRYTQLQELIGEGETMSDKINEAIACYLREQAALDLLEAIANNAVSVEECLPPHPEYIVSGDLIRKAGELVAQTFFSPQEGEQG